jgi:hypothetical protein
VKLGQEKSPSHEKSSRKQSRSTGAASSDEPVREGVQNSKDSIPAIGVSKLGPRLGLI